MENTNKKKFILASIAVVLVLGAGIFLYGYSQDFKGEYEREIEQKIALQSSEDFDNAQKINYVVLYGGKKIKVELATDEATRAQGLSGRKELKEDEGLLFVFEKPGKYAFWMKDMNFPIDIIWIDASFNSIVYIKKDAKPESFPETFGPGPSHQEATYVLEVPAGFSEKYNLKEGDRIGFE